MKLLKITDIKEHDMPYLLMTDFDNYFPVFVDDNNNFIFNLNETLNFQIDNSAFDEYICTKRTNWNLISYELYGTTRLYWLLLKLNDISPLHIFDTLENGTKIKYIDKSYLQQILDTFEE